MTKYGAAIIGCGNIAGGYDKPGDEHILTHAHAYTRHSSTHLAAVTDISQERAKEFALKWNVPGVYTDSHKMLEEVRPDIVSICSPDDSHDKWLDACLNFPVKAVWCEKPLVMDVRLGERLVDAYEKQGILLVVDYLRRWDTKLDQIRQLCHSLSGADLKAIIFYGKGLHHNGSHAVDLLLDWFGNVSEVYPLSTINDYKISDLTVSAYLKFNNGAEAYLIGNDERQFTLWEIDIIGPSWRFKLEQSGLLLKRYRLRDDPVFIGYREFDPVPEFITTDLHIDVYLALDNIVNAIHEKQALRSTGKTALETLKVCEALANKAQFLDKRE